MFWKTKTQNDFEKEHAKIFIDAILKNLSSAEIIETYKSLQKELFGSSSDLRYRVSNELYSIMLDLKVYLQITENDNKFGTYLLLDKYASLNDSELKYLILLRLKKFINDTPTEKIYKYISKGLVYKDQVVKVEKFFVINEDSWTHTKIYKSLEELDRFYIDIAYNSKHAPRVVKLSKRESRIIAEGKESEYGGVIFPYTQTHPFKEEERD